ncbi:MAG: hypothetical protein ACRD9Y_25300 [Blastocatellia bacterium]
MAYSDFTLTDIKQKFQITIDEETDLFSTISEVPASAWLTETLSESVQLALAIGSEKARSELIIAPLLLAFRKISPRKISLFSGLNFNVDPALGLTGFCDFIISRSPEQLMITAPVLIAIEAKNENINAGMPQCMAAMIAARIFNERENQPISTIYGVVTAGNLWRFLKLEADVIFIDRSEYHISQVEKILGILCSTVSDDSAFAIESSVLKLKAA